MGGMEETGQVLAAKFAVIFPHLDKRRLLLLGAEARALGHGGIRLVARLISQRTLSPRYVIVIEGYSRRSSPTPR